MIHDVEQNTEAWMTLRMGKVTASNFPKIMANYGKAFGNPAKDYAKRVAIESFTKTPVETFKNEWMERGHELEQWARSAYEMQTFNVVLPAGFSEIGYFGASADGLVDDDGLIEIKSVKYNIHFDRLQKGRFDSSYEWQMRGQLWLYDRAWCDFVSYCPEFPPDKQLYIFRVERDLELEKRLIGRLDEFLDLLDTYIEVLQSGASYSQKDINKRLDKIDKDPKK